MTDTATEPTTQSTDDDRPWLRTITFTDTSPNVDPATGPADIIHVCTGPILFNGERTTATIQRGNFTVEAASLEGTVVSFDILAADVEWRTIPGFDTTEETVPWAIAGLRILIPVDTKGHHREWERTPNGDNPEFDVLTAHVFVREVHFQ